MVTDTPEANWSPAIVWQLPTIPGILLSPNGATDNSQGRKSPWLATNNNVLSPERAAEGSHA
ncbi:hypothetical protein Pan97_52480 [Bremerella volcania]|uniref:Uncharacterized protein n=1 Tax=Bremerella volcania TaxID=2527984 RepID=A0A518CG18_9BACT|nr:hypothetical protein [Bremerella volcania]QDU78165.1 hypothetical protein Pan97_52480 [Bremerella volcania]